MGNLCSGVDGHELREDGGRFIIHFIGATDVPKADITSETDPFIKSYIVEGKLKSKPYKSLIRDDNPNPIWDSYHDFRIAFNMDAYLVVEIWDNDLHKDELVGDVMIPLRDLQDEQIKIYPLSYRIGSPQSNPKFSVTLQRVYMNTPPKMKKTIFIIRHGQSKWNEAQADGNYLKLVGLDHPLSARGVQQAEALNSRWRQNHGSNGDSERRSTISGPKRVTFLLPSDNSASEHQLYSGGTDSSRSVPLPCAGPDDFDTIFKAVEHIYTSPLTRAIQTALVGLQNHHGLTQKGLTLYSPIREAKKTVAGLDCIGFVVGDNIKERTLDSLRGITGKPKADDICRPVIHIFH